MRRRYRDLPIYAKILVPFAVLITAWGGFGTAILAHSTTSEARARSTAQLSAAFDGARAVLADDEQNLLQAERLAANTQGVDTAVKSGDTTTLRKLLEPLALNAGHDGLRVIDRTGTVLLSLDTSVKPAKLRHESTVTIPEVLQAARGESDARGDKFATFGSTELLVAGPVKDARGHAIGAVIVSDDLAELAGRMARGTSARIVVFTPEGAPRAATGGPLPFRAPTTSGLQLRVKIDGRTMEALYGPLDLRGERAGVLGVAFPTKVLLGGIQGRAAILALLVGIAVLVALLVGLLTARAITKPVDQLVAATHALEQGDLQARAPEGSRDEVGKLSESFNAMAEQLETSHRELEQKVAERTAALKTANAQLVRTSSAKSAFIAALSHELRTPLNGIIGFADMLSDPLFGEHSAEETKELALNITASGRHLLGLINDLLDMAKIEAGKIEMRLAPVDVSLLAVEVGGGLTALARAKQITVITEFGERLPRAMADPARLRQVLFNLISNAIKFTPEGGRIMIDGVHDEHSITISVSDTGPGLSQEETIRIFQPYERGEAGREGDGAGLGLSLARSLVELQGGRIWAESEKGKGSTFSFTVPVANVEQLEPPVREKAKR